MHKWLIDFLKELNVLVPPVGHKHAIKLFQYGQEPVWTDEVGVEVFSDGECHVFFLEDTDLVRSPRVAALAIAEDLKREKLPSRITYAPNPEGKRDVTETLRAYHDGFCMSVPDFSQEVLPGTPNVD